MVVVAIIAILATIAVRLSAKAPRGEKAGAFARQLILAAHEARETAITVGATTRLRLISATNRIVNERLDPNTGVWLPIGGGAVAPSGVELCSVAAGVQLGTSATPTCPNGQDTRICFSPTGRVTIAPNYTSDNCPGNIRGATIYAHTTDGTANAKQYKLVLFSLTGAARLLDRW